ncbi:DNA-processing protein DprA [Limnochorda pilosa]|uniref:DNA protecting protein DprA n=1 Tax=Limnochorda pilosa TaxID=1555112 RepID=A0A0K2SK66_LIMPI|nr:DNA-processing protein DprA [Limnochorda pilosa]BAS27490.1 DNA protecting protein DprA [Limnochorda pilosa]
MSSADAARERLDLVRLYAALPPHLAYKIFKHYASASRAWEAFEAGWRALGVDDAQVAQARAFDPGWAHREILRLGRTGVQVVTPLLPGYPPSLSNVKDAPPLLFMRGSWQPMDEGAVSIVGTRRCTPYGESVAAELGAALARAGVTVVSGLARGVDAAAHRAALEAGGRTVAVMATGPDRIYPPEHRKLARAIEAQGALITEFPPGTHPEPYYFPHRNRIIAALSWATVVVEAGERSGALITADLALTMGRTVFAVPGPIHRPQSRGCHRLIREGATLLGSAADLIEEVRARQATGALPQGTLPGIASEPPEGAGPPSSDPQRWLYDRLDREPRTLEELVRRCGSDVGSVQAGLSLLELRGWAVRVGGRYWRRRW